MKEQREVKKQIEELEKDKTPQEKYWWIQLIPAGLSLIAITISILKLCEII